MPRLPLDVQRRPGALGRDRETAQVAYDRLAVLVEIGDTVLASDVQSPADLQVVVNQVRRRITATTLRPTASTVITPTNKSANTTRGAPPSRSP